MTEFDLGIEAAKSPEAWAQGVREYYDRQAEEGSADIALTDHHIWSIPGGNYEAELAEKGLRLVSEVRNDRHLVWVDPITLDNRGKL